MKLIEIVEDGELKARISGFDHTPKGLNRYTGFVSYDGEYEEIDVDAVNSTFAKKIILIEMKENYAKGGKLKKVEQRFGMYL